jgi:hypothetical protein
MHGIYHLGGLQLYACFASLHTVGLAAFTDLDHAASIRPVVRDALTHARAYVHIPRAPVRGVPACRAAVAFRGEAKAHTASGCIQLRTRRQRLRWAFARLCRYS